MSHLQHPALGRRVGLVKLLPEQVGDHGGARLRLLRVRRARLLAVDVSLDRQRQALKVVHLRKQTRVCV